MPRTIPPLDIGDPQQIGNYRLIGKLGEGGQGAVYLGETPLGARVAVKMLRPTKDPKAHKRFLAEAEAARRVAPFCTAKVLDAGVVNHSPYIISEYIAGQSLKEAVNSNGPLTGSDLERLAVTTLTALNAIHRAEIIHRDFKPQNVILGPGGPVIIDFGIARLTDQTASYSGPPIGTFPYMAPEHINDNIASPASDVFSWAATMVYAATGHLAFAGATLQVIIVAVLTRAPDLTGVPDNLGPLLAACLNKQSGARPTIDHLLGHLTHAHGSRPFDLSSQSSIQSQPVDSPSPMIATEARPASTDVSPHVTSMADIMPKPDKGKAVPGNETSLSNQPDIDALRRDRISSRSAVDDGRPAEEITPSKSSAADSLPHQESGSGPHFGSTSPTDRPIAKGPATKPFSRDRLVSDLSSVNRGRFSGNGATPDGFPGQAAPPEQAPPDQTHPSGRSRRLLRRALISILALVLVSGGLGWYFLSQWLDAQYFVGARGEEIVLFQGVNTSLGPIEFFSVAHSSATSISVLGAFQQGQVRDGIPVASVDAGLRKIQELTRSAAKSGRKGKPSPSATPEPTMSQ
ncbi:serine/threonine protein kinase [Streptosporangium sp. NPDC002607]